MRTSIVLFCLVFAGLAFAESCPAGAADCFMCGAAPSGVPCSRNCQGVWDSNVGDFVVCKCPQGEPCECYCPYGATPQAGGQQPTKQVVAYDEELLKDAAACQDLPPVPCPTCGVITSFTGKIAIKRDGEWCFGYTDLALQPGDVVWTTPDSKLEIMLFDGGRLHAGPDSKFTFVGMDYSNPGGSRTTAEMIMDAARGVYHFMISKDKIEQFEVRPNGAFTGIKGTEFLMEFTDGYTKLKVLDGSVEFGKDGSASLVTVNAGEYSVLNTGESVASYPQEFNVAGESRWWENQGCCGPAFLLPLLLGAAILSRRE